jgi:hypothetical protein
MLFLQFSTLNVQISARIPSKQMFLNKFLLTIVFIKEIFITFANYTI